MLRMKQVVGARGFEPRTFPTGRDANGAPAPKAGGGPARGREDPRVDSHAVRVYSGRRRVAATPLGRAAAAF